MLEASPVSSALLYPIFVSRETVDYQSARVKPGRFSLFFFAFARSPLSGSARKRSPVSFFFSLVRLFPLPSKLSNSYIRAQYTLNCRST